ncbi:MAG: GTPase HflX, partial [Phycisphaerales bacterium]|nr:GTPase HflX [Phycisphaerales bacterium]
GAAGGTGVGAVGGIGTRGPGEKQIEIDRRIVRDRVSALKRELATINERKMRTVQSRRECFTVSLVGYTNSGKSTLLNRLTNAGQFVADMLFATLDTKTVRWAVDESTTVLLSDTVGFVRDLPHHLVASFRATLEEALHADLLLHVVDASNPYAVGQVSAVQQVLDELGCSGIPTVAVLNKIDASTDPVNEQILVTRLPNAVRLSALTGEGIDGLAEAVRRAATADTVRVTLRVPAGDGRLAALIDREAKVLERRYLEDVVELDVRMERRHLDRLTGQHPELEVAAEGDAAAQPS